MANLTSANKKEEKAAEVYPAGYELKSTDLRIDIRGKRPEESEFDVIRFLDDSYSSGLERVEILHGKGTGRLKTNG